MIDSSIGQHLAEIMPGVETVTLQSRGAGESGLTAISNVKARRKSMTPDRAYRLGFDLTEIVVIWEIYLTSDLTSNPKVGDAIDDSAGVRYQIRHADTFKVVGGAFPCVTTQNRK